MKLGPNCPKCGHLAGVSRLLWGLGKPFDCYNCGAKLVVPKGTGFFLAIAGFLAFWRAKETHEGLQLVALFFVILFAIALVSFLTMKPKLANPESRH